jgi:hypothetical protein
VPFDHAGNTGNGNALGGISSRPGATLRGRLTNLPIYEVPYFTFRNSPLAGANLATVVTSIVRNDMQDRTNGFRQPTDHGDALGNLPVAPGGGVIYREYFLAGNGFGRPGFIRLVADLRNFRLYITPTHYDTWLQVPAAAATANAANPIAPGAAGARNPFYLITGVGAVNELFR